MELWQLTFQSEGTMLDNIALHLILITSLSVYACYIVEELGVIYDEQFHKMQGISVGFLMAIRTTIAYGRYWEGRTHVGGMMAMLRMMALMTVTTVRDGDLWWEEVESQLPQVKALHDRQRKKLNAKVIIEDVRQHMQLLFCLVVSHLQEDSKEDTDELAAPYVRDEREQQMLDIMGKGSKPGKVVMVVGWIMDDVQRAFDAGIVDPQVPWQFNVCCGDFIKSFNGASKVSRTPIPFPYKQLCSWMVMAFCYSAPFPFATAFWKDGALGWGLTSRTMLAAFFTTLSFCGLWATSMEIEDPFGDDANDLPMYEYCDNLFQELDALFSIPHMDGDDILQSIKETQRLQKEKHKMLFDARDATFDGMPLNIPINFKAGGTKGSEEADVELRRLKSNKEHGHLLNDRRNETAKKKMDGGPNSVKFSNSVKTDPDSEDNLF